MIGGAGALAMWKEIEGLGHVQSGEEAALGGTKHLRRIQGRCRLFTMVCKRRMKDKPKLKQEGQFLSPWGQSSIGRGSAEWLSGLHSWKSSRPD